MRFGKPRLGKRGYDEDSVDDFLDRVAASVGAMQERITALEQELATRQTPHHKFRPSGKRQR